VRLRVVRACDFDRLGSDTDGMSSGPLKDHQARREFVADPAVLAGLEIGLDELADEDLRAVVIRAEHPELEDGLKAGVRELEGPNGPINPRLHLVMHGIVANQLWDDSPPEVWETAPRLLDSGYERHEILHMLGRPVAAQVWEAWIDERLYDRDAHVVALRALPGTWEQEREALGSERAPDGARRREAAARKHARRQAKSARRRNRRG
jgi:Domain of unknown function (DUF1841)